MNFDLRRVRAAVGIATLAISLGAVAFGTPATRAEAQGAAPAAPPTLASPVANLPTPRPYRGTRLNGGQPTPFPQTTLGPLTGASSLPYPAYGTPVPGVDAGKPAADVPATITLPQAILVAFARSPALEIARQDVVVQAAAVRLERAGLLPSLSATATVDRTHSQGGSGSIGTGIQTSAYTSNNASFGATLNQLIFDGGKVAASVAAARSSEAAASDTYQRQMQTVAYNVATTYYNYLAAERTTQVDLELVRDDVVQENLVRAQVAVGTEARASIATAQLPTAQARLAVVRAQGSELSAEAAFANAMGLDANVRVQPIDDAPVYTNSPVSTIPVPSYDIAVARAIALRPDYDSEVQLVNQSQSQVRAASLGLFPTLAGQGSATDASTGKDFAAFRNNNTVAVNLSVPIFDGGTTAANTTSAKAQLAIARANLRATTLTVSLNVKQGLTGLVSSRAAFDQTQQEYATALVNVQSTQAQYRAGVTTLPLLLNAEVQLTQALTDQVTAVYTLRQSEQTYLYQVGANYDPTGGGRTVSMAFPILKRGETPSVDRKNGPHAVIWHR